VFVLALLALLGELATALSLGMVEFVVRRLFRLAGFVDLLFDLVYEGAQLVVRALLHLGLEFIDPLDERFNSTEFAVVRVNEAIQEAKH
jgi:hypothetical protein